MKRYDLMHGINGVHHDYQIRSALSQNQATLISHPISTLSLDPKWYGNHLAYTLSKMNMNPHVYWSWAEEFKDKIAVNALCTHYHSDCCCPEFTGWGSNDQDVSQCRYPGRCSVLYILRSAKTLSGKFCIDEEILKEEGINDFSKIYYRSCFAPMSDLFLNA